MTDVVKRRGRKKQDTVEILKTPLTTFTNDAIVEEPQKVDKPDDVIMFIPTHKASITDNTLQPYNSTDYSPVIKGYTDLDHTVNRTLSVNDCKAIPIEQYAYTCLNCTYGFNTSPYSIPLKCQIVKNNGTVVIGSAREYQTYGTFCMAECMYQYILDNHFHKKEEIISLMYSYIRYRNGVDSVDTIVPAGRKELLKKYGGTMTIDEYRNKMKLYYTVCIPPMIHLEHVVTSVSVNKKSIRFSN
jgi:hypothetical protein